MPNKHRLIYVAILSALATACSTGSNLNTGGHQPVTNIPGTGGNDNGGSTGGNDNNGNTGGNEPAKTNFATISDSEVQKANSSTDDGKTEEPAPKVEYGHTQPAAITGYIYHDEEKDRDDFFTKPATIDLKTAQVDNEENFNEITFTNYKGKQKTESINITPKHWTDDIKADNYASSVEYSGNVSDETKKGVSYLYNTNNQDQLKLFELENTKIGMLMKVDDSGQFVNLFYKAQNPSNLIPSDGKATYEGLWDVMRDVAHHEFNTQKTSGYGEELKLAAAKFDVNFKDKTITGNLAPRKYEILGQNRAFAYDLAGDITGNRFTGKATATGESKEDLRDATFNGGFFGDQASELAGTIQNTEVVEDTDKPGIFGVFAAKQTSKEGLVEGKEQPKTIYNQAKAITADTKADKVFATDFTEVLAGTEKLPNIDKITINGVEIDLLKEVKKSPSSVFGNEESLPLQFTRIGGISDDETDKFSFFYQGQLTQIMPTTGDATYEGNWIGYGKSEKGSPFSMSKDSNAKINFTADFAKKTLSGKFLTPAGVDAMTLNDVNITGNTFAGKANIEGSGLTNDKDGTQDRIKGSVNVSGGFFGDKANELGGQFSKDDKNFAGVFAGKKVADK